MGLYPIDSKEAYQFSKGIVGEIIEKVDEETFRNSCRRIKSPVFPLRYHRARFAPRIKKTISTEKYWNDLDAPFGYETITYHDRNVNDTVAYVDVFGCHGQGAILNNIIIEGIDPFGLDADDDLSDLIRRITRKQEDEFRGRLLRRRDELTRIRLRYGAHDRRYKEALADEPKMEPTITDIARNEIELLFSRLTFDKQPFALVGLDLEQRSMSFGVELGTGGHDKGARYFGILELGKNSRWNNDCLMYSAYAKKDGKRCLHPFLVRGDTLRKDTVNDLTFFIARSIVLTNQTQEFFAHFSTEVHRFYKRMFPFSSVPGPKAQP